MPPSQRSFGHPPDQVPFLFGCARATALPGPVLVDLLTSLGGTVAAAKAMLHRMVDVGMLSLERHGRVGVYRLAGAMRANAEAISSQAQTLDWDGRFHTVVYDIPERHRSARDQLRTAAFSAGYRPLRPGLLLSPTQASDTFVGDFDDFEVMVGWLELEQQVAQRVAAEVWGLADVSAAMHEQIVSLEAALAEGPAQHADERSLVQLYGVMSPAAAVQLRAGRLPLALLPGDWPGQRLSELMRACSATLVRTVSSYVADVVRTSRYAALAVVTNADN